VNDQENGNMKQIESVVISCLLDMIYALVNYKWYN